MTDQTIRQSQVSGMFYPGDPVELRTLIESYFDQVELPGKHGEVVGLISPHAGYQYSGLTAAHGYGALRSSRTHPPEVAVIISPSHREYFRGISVYSGDGYATPLGTMNVHTALRTDLLRLAMHNPVADFFTACTRGHEAEHALEVQLPFLQTLFGDIPIIPLVMGDQSREHCFLLGRMLATALVNTDAVLVASSDLSHFHSSAKADTIDSVFIKFVSEFDEDGLMHALERERTEACGGGPAVALMSACRLLGVTHPAILDHRNSGAITGDRSSVVGYLSATISR